MRISIVLAAASLLLAGCHTTTKVDQQTLKQIPAALLGRFKDDYGSVYTITEREWKHGKSNTYQLLQYNKDENYFIARNGDANPTDAGLYTRIDILYLENMEPYRWGYCLTAYKAATVQDAMTTAAADRTNPRKGCNGYPFSRMKRE